MSLQPQEVPSIPEEIQRIARAAFPKGNVHLRMSDGIGAIFDDPMLAAVFPARGQSAESPWPLSRKVAPYATFTKTAAEHRRRQPYTNLPKD